MFAWIILKRAAFSGNNFNTGRNPQFPGQGNLMKSAGKLCLYTCARMCVCVPLRLLITSGVMWCDKDPKIGQ